MTENNLESIVNEPSSNTPGKDDSKRLLGVVIIGLVIFALIATATRMWLQQKADFPAGDQIWSVTLFAEFHAPEAGAVIQIAPPWDTHHARLYEQKLLHPGTRIRRTKSNQQNRDTQLITTRSGKFNIEAHYGLHISHIPRANATRTQLVEKNRSKWLASEPGIPVESPLVIRSIDSLKKNGPDAADLVNHIFEVVSETIVIRTNGNDDGGLVLERKRGSDLGVNRAFVALVRAAHLPARLITGLKLSGAKNYRPIFWAEVYYQNQWHSMDVVNGHFNELPPDYIPLRKGSEPLFNTENARIMHSYWNIQPARAPKGLLVSDAPNFLHVFDLTRLSPNVRDLLAILLLLPLGALATEFLRQIVGIRTYGTFTPTLLALAAVFVDWITAAVTFTLVTLLGIAGRAMLPKLELARVPRLSIVFTLIAIIMTLVVSILNYFDPTNDPGIILLPIVILTTLVDRIYTIADERGVRIALIRLGWTIAAAMLSVAILLQIQWGERLLAYPEIHAITMAAIILLGSYKGKRLSSYRMLVWLKEPSVKKQKEIIPD